jgi:hypothetical protein
MKRRAERHMYTHTKSEKGKLTPRFIERSRKRKTDKDSYTK